MTIPNHAETLHDRDVLAHWQWTIPILLIVAFLSIRQINLYGPTHDEFVSMFHAGWFASSPYSPIEVVESLQTYSPNHTPGYFLLLSLWGNLTATDLATGRLFAIFCGLLALSTVYRLARDFVSPTAALFALVIVASNAFFNFYHAYVRMYTLLFFCSGTVLWLYLHILYRAKTVHRRHLLALFAASFVLMNIHPFSATVFLALGIYHLLFVPKSICWWRVTVVAVAAALLFSPNLPGLTSKGIEMTILHKSGSNTGGWGALASWLDVTSNGQPLLLVISLAGLFICVWTKKIPFPPFMLLVLSYVVVLWLTAELTPFVAARDMRHQLGSWSAALLLIVTGLYSLYRFRKWLGLLVLLWVVAALHFHASTDWRTYVSGRVAAFEMPPWHAISQELSRSGEESVLIAYRMPAHRLLRQSYINFSLKQHYMDRENINVAIIGDLGSFESFARHNAIVQFVVWISLQTSLVTAEEIDVIDSTMYNLDYVLCDRSGAGIDTEIRRYAWTTLGCQEPNLLANYENALFDYHFYGAQLDANGSKVLFTDEWTANVDELPDNSRISYQLISSDWENVAQMDLPLVHEGKPRRFSIDVAGVPAGSYRLMAILYDKATGIRSPWIDNESDPPYMLLLAEIVIPPS